MGGPSNGPTIFSGKQKQLKHGKKRAGIPEDEVAMFWKQSLARHVHVMFRDYVQCYQYKCKEAQVVCSTLFCAEGAELTRPKLEGRWFVWDIVCARLGTQGYG